MEKQTGLRQDKSQPDLLKIPASLPFLQFRVLLPVFEDRFLILPARRSDNNMPAILFLRVQKALPYGFSCCSVHQLTKAVPHFQEYGIFCDILYVKLHCCTVQSASYPRQPQEDKTAFLHTSFFLLKNSPLR